MPNSFYGVQNQPSPPPENIPENTRPENIKQNTTSDTSQQESTTFFPDSSQGQLVVSVFTANQLLPVVNATVTVAAENGTTQEELSSDTDRSGRTIAFTLAAPPASASQEPTQSIPFAEYRVTITHPDYFTAVIENVQVFGDNLTLLPVNLIPIPEFSNGDIDRTVIIPRQNL